MASVKNLTFKEVLELVRPDLLRVEEEFGVQTTTGVRPITEIGQYLQEGGGKRLRPALVLLAAKLCGYEGHGGHPHGRGGGNDSHRHPRARRCDRSG